MIQARDMERASVDARECETRLNRWLVNYSGNGPWPRPTGWGGLIPLESFKLEVKAVPGQPGYGHIVAWLRPG